MADVTREDLARLEGRIDGTIKGFITEQTARSEARERARANELLKFSNRLTTVEAENRRRSDETIHEMKQISESLIRHVDSMEAARAGNQDALDELVKLHREAKARAQEKSRVNLEAEAMRAAEIVAEHEARERWQKAVDKAVRWGRWAFVLWPVVSFLFTLILHWYASRK